jgi:hypothetical protein
VITLSRTKVLKALTFTCDEVLNIQYNKGYWTPNNQR